MDIETVELEICAEVENHLKTLDQELAEETPHEAEISKKQSEWMETALRIEQSYEFKFDQQKKVFEKRRAEEIAKIEERKQQEIDNINLHGIQNDLLFQEQKLANLGFLKFSEKKACNERIAELRTKLEVKKAEVAKIENRYNTHISDKKDAHKAEEKQLRMAVYAENPIPESPLQKQRRLAFIRQARQMIPKERSFTAEGLETMCLICIILSKTGMANSTFLLNVIRHIQSDGSRYLLALKPDKLVTTGKVSASVLQLEKDGIVERIVNDERTYFRIKN